jgi:hypothetical protein
MKVRMVMIILLVAIMRPTAPVRADHRIGKLEFFLGTEC